MSEEIFTRILNNSSTETEKNSFYQELEADSSLKDAFLQYKTLYVLSALQNKENINPSEHGFENLWHRLNPSGGLTIRDLWYRYAAIFIVALALGVMVQYLVNSTREVPVYTHQIEYSSEKGAVSKIHLEDGSTIWLSSGSKINITKRSTGEMSAVLKGEAYFDMVPDPNRNFIVDLGFFQVKDIGTKFDIRAYPEEHYINAALADGQIDFCKGSNEKMHSLKPGEFMHFDKQTSRMTVSRQDPSIATAWKDGKFVFIHKTLAEICHELESWYNVTIIIKNKSLAGTRYTSVIKRTTTVKLVLNMLSLTDQINYTINDRKEDKDIVYIY